MPLKLQDYLALFPYEGKDKVYAPGIGPYVDCKTPFSFTPITTKERERLSAEEIEKLKGEGKLTFEDALSISWDMYVMRLEALIKNNFFDKQIATQEEYVKSNPSDKEAQAKLRNLIETRAFINELKKNEVELEARQQLDFAKIYESLKRAFNSPNPYEEPILVTSKILSVGCAGAELERGHFDKTDQSCYQEAKTLVGRVAGKLVIICTSHDSAELPDSFELLDRESMTRLGVEPFTVNAATCSKVFGEEALVLLDHNLLLPRAGSRQEAPYVTDNLGCRTMSLTMPRREAMESLIECIGRMPLCYEIADGRLILKMPDEENLDLENALLSADLTKLAKIEDYSKKTTRSAEELLEERKEKGSFKPTTISYDEETTFRISKLPPHIQDIFCDRMIYGPSRLLPPDVKVHSRKIEPVGRDLFLMPFSSPESQALISPVPGFQMPDLDIGSPVLAIPGRMVKEARATNIKGRSPTELGSVAGDGVTSR